MTDSTLSIERVRPHTSVANIIAQWTYDTWGHLHPELGFEQWRADTQDHCGAAGIPSVFAAFMAKQPIGTASLVASDMTDRPDLTPWLASVFVASAWRGHGIASALVRHVEHHARETGLDRLYLYTPDQYRLYSRLGWLGYVDLTYRGEHVRVMTRDL